MNRSVRISISIMIAALLCIGLCACGKNAGSETKEAERVVPVVEEISEPETVEEAATESAEAETEEASEEEAESKLRYDGYYACLVEESDNDTNQVFRFFPDGKVISASVYEEKGKVTYPDKSWFTVENATDINSDYAMYIGIGDVILDGDSISFADVAEYYLDGAYENVIIDYSGTVEEDRLVLDSYSHYNDNKEEGEVYKFISFDDITEWE